MTARIAGALLVVFLAAAGCAGVRPGEADVTRGIAAIMVDQGLSDDGAQRVAACVTEKIYDDADTISLQRLAKAEHAVLPADERRVSAAEADCVLSAGA